MQNPDDFSILVLHKNKKKIFFLYLIMKQ